MNSPELTALSEQLDELSALVDDLADDDYARPTRCPGWSVAELVAHCEGILLRLVQENAQPVDGEAEIDRVGYYRYEPDEPREGEDPGKTFSEVIRDRVIGEVAGRDGGELRTALEAAKVAALEGVRAIPSERVIQRSGHPRITYGELVASRNLELGVHTMDLAAAVGREERVAPATGAIITEMLDALLGAALPDALRWDTATYVLKGTGRRPITAAERAVLDDLADRFPLLE